MAEQKNTNKTLDEEEIHFIELPKFLKKQFNSQDKIEQWLAFIDYSRKEWVKMAVEKNIEVKKAEKEYEYSTGEEAEKRLAFLREKGERDYNNGMQYAMRTGIEKGIEKGKEEEKQQIR